MSRYTEIFQSHPFQSRFKELMHTVDQIDLGDLSITTSVTEIQRLKKVINYIHEVLLSLDPELVPLTIWDSFFQQSGQAFNELINYSANRNIVHIQNTNAYADNLLNYVRPYMLLKGKAKTVAENVYAQSQKQIEEYLTIFQDRVKSKLNEIESILSESQQSHGQIDAIFNEVYNFNEKLFAEHTNEIGLVEKIQASHKLIEKLDEEIKILHSTLLDDLPKQKSYKTEIIEAKNEIEEQRGIVIKLASSVFDEVEELREFHKMVYGGLDDKGNVVVGLSDEVKNKLEVLSDLETNNKTRYDAVVTEIQSLLPGATSAGLATAYRQMKNSYNKPIKTFECLFYIAIGLLVFITTLSIFQNVSISKETWFTYELTNFATWNDAFKAMLIKLPLYGALGWFAFFVSKRRSENQRLQQEYAHKEALAKSYGSYKKQIEALDTEDMLMQKEFIGKMIDAIAFNASQTLDGNHGDKHPLQEVFDRLSDRVEGKITFPEFVSLFKK